VRDIPVTPITFGVASRIVLGYTGRDVYDSPSTLAGSMEHERTAWLAKMRFPLNFYLSSETLPNVPLIGQFWTPPRGSAAHDAGIPGTQSDTPRRAGGLMCRAASKAADMTPGVFVCAGPSVSPTLVSQCQFGRCRTARMCRVRYRISDHLRLSRRLAWASLPANAGFLWPWL
jgi:hypothetical protein